MALQFLIASEDEQLIGITELETLTIIYGKLLDPIEAVVELACYTKEQMQVLNLEQRGINEPTDVLSFPVYTSLVDVSFAPAPVTPLGTIIICPEKAILYNETLPQLVHHGLLHLLGFDHEQDIHTWKIEEQKVLNDLAEHGLIIPGIPHDTL